jgi:glutathione synthase/RimK-type ligase-like ATP-grasp enzyme
VRTLRVLLSEGSSLSAREIISVLGPAGHELDVMDPDRWCLARFSRWVRDVVHCPPVGQDPLGYLDAVAARLHDRRYDVLLPTHEQVYLFARLRRRLPREIGLAVADPSAFAHVQSKVSFCRLLERLGLPQPRYQLLSAPAELDAWAYPYWLKAAFSTAGQDVRLVRSGHERADALAALWPAAGGLLAQAPAHGTYG